MPLQTTIMNLADGLTVVIDDPHDSRADGTVLSRRPGPDYSGPVTVATTPAP